MCGRGFNAEKQIEFRNGDMRTKIMVSCSWPIYRSRAEHLHPNSKKPSFAPIWGCLANLSSVWINFIVILVNLLIQETKSDTISSFVAFSMWYNPDVEQSEFTNNHYEGSLMCNCLILDKKSLIVLIKFKRTLVFYRDLRRSKPLFGHITTSDFSKVI